MGLQLLIALLFVVPAFAQSPIYGQCGGIGWTGPTTCVSGTVCKYSNDWYSQCLPGTATTTAVQTTPTPTPTPTGTPTTTRTTVIVDTTPTFPATTTTPISPSGTGLSSKFQAKGKVFFGTCADSSLLSNSQNAAVIKTHFGGLTPENSMKWDSIESSQNNFNFGGGDTLVTFAKANGKLVRGHTLVWHSQLPSWVSSISSAATITSVINNHIAKTAGHFKGSLYAWDVCNEILNEDGSLRSSVFSNLLGESFVAIAFKAARAADPAAKLYINDYNLDSNNAKAQGIVALVKRTNASGQLIDGIGTQMHLEAGGVGGITAVLTLLASTGLDVAITELDIKGASSNDYTTVVKACLAQPKCVTLTVWGVRDPDSWRASYTPLLFDANYQPKAAFNAISALL